MSEVPKAGEHASRTGVAKGEECGKDGPARKELKNQGEGREEQEQDEKKGNGEGRRDPVCAFVNVCESGREGGGTSRHNPA